METGTKIDKFRATTRFPRFIRFFQFTRPTRFTRFTPFIPFIFSNFGLFQFCFQLLIDTYYLSFIRLLEQAGNKCRVHLAVW